MFFELLGGFFPFFAFNGVTNFNQDCVFLNKEIYTSGAHILSFPIF